MGQSFSVHCEANTVGYFNGIGICGRNGNQPPGPQLLREYSKPRLPIGLRPTKGYKIFIKNCIPSPTHFYCPEQGCPFFACTRYFGFKNKQYVNKCVCSLYVSLVGELLIAEELLDTFFARCYPFVKCLDLPCLYPHVAVIWEYEASENKPIQFLTYGDEAVLRILRQVELNKRKFKLTHTYPFRLQMQRKR